MTQALLEVKKFVDTRQFQYTITEEVHPETKRKVMKVAGLFQKTEEKNENNRLYPDRVWDKVVNDSKIQQKIRERSMLGELEHPDDLQTKLPRVSHIITKLEKRGNEIYGEAEILNTPAGLILQELFRAGVRVGISSRGKGTSVWMGDTEVVNDDYVLDTFDFVANPATTGAYPKVVSESLQNVNKELDMNDLELIQARLEDIRLLVTKGRNLVESRQDKYKKELSLLQQQLAKFTEKPETKYHAEELLEDIKELKKILKEKEYCPKCPDCPDCPNCQHHKGAEEEIEEPDMEEKKKCPPKKKGGPEEEEKEEDIEECQKCRTRLVLEAKSKVYYCGNCYVEIPITEALTKKTLSEKYAAQVLANSTLVEQARSLREANKIINQRLDSAVKTLGKLITENKKLMVENYVVKLVNRFPVLSKYQEQLLKCDSIECVDKQIELLQPYIEKEKKERLEAVSRVVKTESKVEDKPKISSGPSKKLEVKVEKNSNGTKPTTTTDSSLAEKIWEKMRLF